MAIYFEAPLPPIARTNSPATSHLAAKEITESRGRQTLMRLALHYVRDNPGQTAGQIGDALGLHRSVIAKRLSDLKNAELIVQGPAVRTHGKAQVTWYPVSDQLTLF
jgi:predicted ArsR family transcriptional regulator